MAGLCFYLSDSSTGSLKLKNLFGGLVGGAGVGGSPSPGRSLMREVLSSIRISFSGLLLLVSVKGLRKLLSYLSKILVSSILDPI